MNDAPPRTTGNLTPGAVARDAAGLLRKRRGSRTKRLATLALTVALAIVMSLALGAVLVAWTIVAAEVNAELEADG